MEFNEEDPIADWELIAAVAAVQNAADEETAAAESLAKAKFALVELMRSRQLDSEVVEGVDGGLCRVTLVQGERAVIDDDGLRSAIGTRAWSKLTTRKVNRDLLTTAMAKGQVDPAIVGRFVKINPVAPYAKITSMEQR